MTPIFKKGNCRAVSILPHLSKVFERIYTNKSIVLWKTSFYLTYAALEKVTMRSTRFL